MQDAGRELTPEGQEVGFDLGSKGKPWERYRDMCVHAQSRSTLCDPTGCSLPGSSDYGILQARILEWVAMPSSRGSSQPRDWTCVSWIAGGFLTCWATWEPCRDADGHKDTERSRSINGDGEMEEERERERERDDGFGRCVGCKSEWPGGGYAGGRRQGRPQCFYLEQLVGWGKEGVLFREMRSGGDGSMAGGRWGQLGTSLLMELQLLLKIPPSHLSAGKTPASPPIPTKIPFARQTHSSLSSTILPVQTLITASATLRHTYLCCLCHICLLFA